MEQSFLLKYFGGYDLFEQAVMTAEDRNWNIKRIQRELKKQNEPTSSGPKHIPGQPAM